MNFNNLLNQVLDTVQKSGNSALSGKNGNPLNSFGGGALVGSLASMLLKKKGGGSLVKAGSMAALGMLAYKAPTKTGRAIKHKPNRKARSHPSDKSPKTTAASSCAP